MKIKNRIAELKEEIRILECVVEFAETTRIEYTRTDALHKEFVERFNVEISPRRFARLLCENYNLKPVQTKILNERCYVYESKSVPDAN